MTTETILLRPLGPVLSRRVAVVLGCLFLAVVGMAWLAVDALAPAPPVAPPLAAVPKAPVRPAAEMLPPATVLEMHPHFDEGMIVPGRLLDESAQATLEGWTTMLRNRPGSRVRLTLTSPESASDELQHRVGAALVRRLSGDDINPHRIQLVLSPDAASVLSPGDFRASIEMGRP